MSKKKTKTKKTILRFKKETETFKKLSENYGERDAKIIMKLMKKEFPLKIAVRIRKKIFYANQVISRKGRIVYILSRGTRSKKLEVPFYFILKPT